MADKSEGIKNNVCCIDFGTSTTAAAILIDGEPHLVRNGNSRCFPTVACVLDNGEIEVCDSAMNMRTHFPESFESEFKLNISDSIDIHGRNYTDLVAAILSFIRRCARIENNGKEINSVVLTIPSLYTPDDPRISVMRNAACAAGFTDISFMSEAIAAARHYRYISGDFAEGITLIYDLGGGTFDPVLIRSVKDKKLEILAVNQGAKCGGQYFDKAVYNAIRDRFRETDSPLLKSARMADYEAACHIKEALSANEQASQMFSNSMIAKMTRKEFNSVTADLVQTTISGCSQLLKSAGKEWSDLSRILFVGGSSVIPAITDALKSHLMASNAASVEIVRNFKGANGNYDYRFATVLGGLSPELKEKPTPPAPIKKETDEREKKKSEISDIHSKVTPKKKSSDTQEKKPSVTLEKICPVCRYTFAEDDIYCSICGHRRGLPVKKCSGCGVVSPNNEETKCCIFCGKKLI